MVSFRLLNISAIVQLIEVDVSIAAEVSGLQCKEYGNILLERFRTKYNTGTCV